MIADKMVANDDGEGDLAFEAELDHPPEKVWRALTESHLLDAWLPPGPPGGPQVTREVVEADPPHTLRWAWRDGGGDPPLDSEVTITLVPTPGGARLTVIHTGLRPAVPANSNTPAWSLKCAA
ncbi:SRPBCC family protein [Caulobacter sp. KR2-114]|uniref:SRPBCC family protein n=1 Tax=Caulobacter sp. KR2-114 TaxID=3400912 RepID=UPI003C06E69B